MALTDRFSFSGKTACCHPIITMMIDHSSCDKQLIKSGFKCIFKGAVPLIEKHPDEFTSSLAVSLSSVICLRLLANTHLCVLPHRRLKHASRKPKQETIWRRTGLTC